jgi:hypothetical protein
VFGFLKGIPVKSSILVAALLFSTATSFAWSVVHPDKESIGPQTDFKNMTADEALGLLAKAQSIKIAGDNHANQAYCNGKRRPDWDTDHRAENGCVHIGEGGYGPNSEYSLATSMEALFRGCGIYAVSTDETWGDDRSGTSCGILGARFAALGNLAVAKAIWEKAPGCHSHDRAGNPINGCMAFVLSSDPDWGVYRGDWHHDYQIQHEQAYGSDAEKLFAMARQACKETLDFSSCLYLKKHGVPIDMQVVREAETQRRQNVREAWDEAEEELAQKDREKDARFNAFMSVLSSMPGAKDPNAIVNAANRQGTEMMALGAANDAARRRSAVAGSGSINSAIESLLGTPSSVNSSTTATTNSSLSSNSNSKRSSAAPSETGPVQCTDMSNFITGAAKVDSNGFVSGVLTSHSDKYLDVVWAFARGGRPDWTGGGSGADTLKPGQTHGGQGAGYWGPIGGPDGVDTNPPRIFWRAVLESENQAHTYGCTQMHTN